MTTARTKVPPASHATDAADEIPWYDLIPEVPEPPEDAMQQEETILVVMSILQARYDNIPGALSFSQSNLIYDSAVPGSFVSPDGCIVLGLKTDAKAIKRDRRSYRIDEWGQVPAFVLEVASESTAARDLNTKREIYARMSAQEYWRLDRRGEYYGDPLVGERLVNGEYVRFPLHREANGDVWSRSEVLGVDFYYREEEEGYGTFLLRDSETGEWLNDLSGEIAARQAAEFRAHEAEARNRASETRAHEAEARAQSEENARQEAETRNRQLEAELQRLRRQLAQE